MNHSATNSTSEVSTSTVPLSIICPKLLESLNATNTTGEVSGVSPLTPEELKQQRLLFIKEFHERLQNTAQQDEQPHSPLEKEIFCKLFSESDVGGMPVGESVHTLDGNLFPSLSPAVIMSNLISPMNLQMRSKTTSRLSIRSNDKRSRDLRNRAMEAMSETTSNSNNNNQNNNNEQYHLSPHHHPLQNRSNHSNNSSTRRISSKFPSKQSPKRNNNGTPKANSLLKDCFLHRSNETKQQFEFPNNTAYANIAADQCTCSEITGDIINEEYDSDYWEDERMLLKWEARRAGLTYFGVEELELHRERTVLSSEEKLKLLMR